MEHDDPRLPPAAAASARMSRAQVRGFVCGINPSILGAGCFAPRIPAELHHKKKASLWGFFLMEQMTGIEPARSAWEAEVLPLNYICVQGRQRRPLVFGYLQAGAARLPIFCRRQKRPLQRARQARRRLTQIAKRSAIISAAAGCSERRRPSLRRCTCGGC